MSNRKLAEELSALATKATPGPWASDHEHSPDDVSLWAGDEFLANMGASRLSPVGRIAFDIEGANATLIVALVNSLPAILSALRAEPDEAEVERVARAIYEARNPASPIRIRFEKLAELGWEQELEASRTLARAAIAAMAAPSTEWLPIETAPKDGSKIQLAVIDGSGNILSDTGKWVEGDTHEEWDEVDDGISIKLWEQQDEGKWTTNYCLYDLEEPTHWKPWSAAIAAMKGGERG